MSLQGKGALAIWNGIADGADAEFIEWHVKEHIPERVGLPGFLSGRRYTAVDGSPAYFNFYEVEAPDVLRSSAYVARLNDPSPWTTSVVSRFTNVSRTLCGVAATGGMGVGAFAEVLGFQSVDDADAAARFAAALPDGPAICAAHLFIREQGPPQVTTETKLRNGPDLTYAAILIAETATPQSAAAIRAGALGDDALARAGFGQPSVRGLYRLDYLLRHEDIAAARASTNIQKEAKA